MQTDTRKAEATVTTIRDDLGHVVGKVYALDTTNLCLFIAEAHDWDGEHGEDNSAYDPIGIGTFVEMAEAVSEITRRAQS